MDVREKRGYTYKHDIDINIYTHKQKDVNIDMAKGSDTEKGMDLHAKIHLNVAGICTCIIT